MTRGSQLMSLHAVISHVYMNSVKSVTPPAGNPSDDCHFNGSQSALTEKELIFEIRVGRTAVVIKKYSPLKSNSSPALTPTNYAMDSLKRKMHQHRLRRQSFGFCASVPLHCWSGNNRHAVCPLGFPEESC